MKKHIARLALFSLVAAGLVAVPAASRADDASATDKPVVTSPPPAPKKKAGASHATHAARKAFHGSVTAVDTAAMSLTVDTNTLYVTSETIITQVGKPATLSEVTVGETASGSYKTDEAGKLDAVTINAGEKVSKKPKKKAKDAAPAIAPEPPAPTK